MRKVCKYENQNYQHIKKVEYISDGCASQYKNYKNFMNLCHHQTDFNLEAEWNFFAISNQKSAVDRIGGTRNHLTARTSLYRPYNNQILSAEAVFTNFRKRNVLFLIKRDYFNLLWDK